MAHFPTSIRQNGLSTSFKRGNITKTSRPSRVLSIYSSRLRRLRLPGLWVEDQPDVFGHRPFASFPDHAAGPIAGGEQAVGLAGGRADRSDRSRGQGNAAANATVAVAAEEGAALEEGGCGEPETEARAAQAKRAKGDVAFVRRAADLKTAAKATARRSHSQGDPKSTHSRLARETGNKNRSRDAAGATG